VGILNKSEFPDGYRVAIGGEEENAGIIIIKTADICTPSIAGLKMTLSCTSDLCTASLSL
jgi:hypothetical protein